MFKRVLFYLPSQTWEITIHQDLNPFYHAFTNMGHLWKKYFLLARANQKKEFLRHWTKEKKNNRFPLKNCLEIKKNFYVNKYLQNPKMKWNFYLPRIEEKEQPEIILKKRIKLHYNIFQKLDESLTKRTELVSRKNLINNTMMVSQSCLFIRFLL